MGNYIRVQKNKINRILQIFKYSDYDLSLPNKILLATHHKTGTVWFNSIFGTICKNYSLDFYKGEQKNLPDQFDVFTQDHSCIDFDLFSWPYRGVHIVRDPRDIIVSGCFYHQKSEESWLHRQRDEFDGMTYQEKINSIEQFDDQLLFEMEHSARRTIIDMTNWDYENPNFFEIKYENLIKDVDLILFHEIFTFLGFPGRAIPDLLTIAYNKSLFSGRKKKSKHVRSGKSKQWKQYFKQCHKDRFLELFGDILIQLGYEQDNDWTVD